MSELESLAVRVSDTGWRVRKPAHRGRFGVGLSYRGVWIGGPGEHSGGTIRRTISSAASATVAETMRQRPITSCTWGRVIRGSAATVSVRVDGGDSVTARVAAGARGCADSGAGGGIRGGHAHAVVISHEGSDGEELFFDFLEIAVPSMELPEFSETPLTTLATDWDTDHSLAIAPERTAWLIDKLGFRGRANHYVGAMWWYELSSPSNRYASGSIEFAGSPIFGGRTEITIAGVTISHLNYITDTAEAIAKCFELLITAGSSAVWAVAEGSTLRVTARALGSAGEAITIAAHTGSESFTAIVSGATLSGGVDGAWLTDLEATPRINRAARDWSRSYVRALRSYGIEAAAAFSMELRHGDDRLQAGIAQRYPDGPCWLNTPALQTNFGPESTTFWKQVYRDMADVMAEAGAVPYLQFGEVQWWYFANAAGMSFYDAYTQARFQTKYGFPMRTIESEHAEPSAYTEEVDLLPRLIGEFTAAVMEYVRTDHPAGRFEVLYPPDTNDTPIGRAVNYPASEWTPEKLACLKTENFTFTGNRNLDKARMSLQGGAERRVPGGATEPSGRDRGTHGPLAAGVVIAMANGVESAVLFALDQFCLIGYSLPLGRGVSRSSFMGTA